MANETQFGAIFDTLKGSKKTAKQIDVDVYEVDQTTGKLKPQDNDVQTTVKEINGRKYISVNSGFDRPQGKRSDPEYERMTVLVRKDTRQKVAIKMLQEPDHAKDLSDLVQKLLDQWVS